MAHQSLKEIACQTIRAKILRGDIKPGMRIREDLLAEEIDMSRTPVREAINQLAAEGLVINIPRRGIYLAEMQADMLLDLIDVREALETLAITRCIEHISNDQLAELNRLQEQFRQSLLDQCYEDCSQLDSAFHRMIAQIAANARLIKFLAEVEDAMQLASLIDNSKNAREKNQTIYKEHGKILACIAAKYPDGAVQAIRENISSMRISLQASLR